MTGSVMGWVTAHGDASSSPTDPRRNCLLAVTLYSVSGLNALGRNSVAMGLHAYALVAAGPRHIAPRRC